MKKSILFIGHDASLTGAPIVLLNFMKWLVQEKKEKCILILKNGGPLLDKYGDVAETLLWESKRSTKSIFFRVLNKAYNFSEKRKKNIVRTISKKTPGLIVSNTIVNGDVLEYLKGMKIPIILWVHELESVIKLFNNSGLSDKSLKYSGYFIAASNAVKTNLVDQHNIPNNKISVINEFVLQRESDSAQKSHLEFIIGACGTLIFRKGFDLFLQTANIVINKYRIKDIRFIWIGGDKGSYSYTEFEREILLLDLQEHVLIMGETDNPFQYYKQLDLFLMTSREDPFPLVNLEAAQLGLPIICFENSGGSPEFVTKDVGYVVPYANTEAMAEKIIELKNDAGKRKWFSENIKRKSEDYVVQKKAPELYELLEHLLNA